MLVTNLNTKNQVTIEKLTNKLQNNITNKLENLKINYIQKNWFINMSNKQILDDVADILRLGGKFAFNYNKTTFLILKICIINVTISFSIKLKNVYILKILRGMLRPLDGLFYIIGKYMFLINNLWISVIL